MEETVDKVMIDELEEVDGQYLSYSLDEGYNIPDNFFYAEDENLMFEYNVKDPYTGENVRIEIEDDDEEGVFHTFYVTDFLGYSIEFEGEYYWTYSVHYSETPEDTEFDGTNTYWTTSDMEEWMVPTSVYGYWDLDVAEYESNLYDDGGTAKLNFQVQAPFLRVKEFYISDGEIVDYKISRKPPTYYTIDDSFKIYINDVQVPTSRLKINNEWVTESELTLYNSVGIAGDEISNIDGETFIPADPDLMAVKEIEIELTQEEIENGAEIRVESTPSQNKFYTQIQNGDYTYDQYRETDKKVWLSYEVENSYDVDFRNSTTEVITIPYHWKDGEEYEFEKFTFNKLFENKYEYPQTTKDLLSIEYSKGSKTNLEVPDMNTKVEATLNIDDQDPIDLNVKYKLGDSTNINEVLFYIDETSYYDYENQELVIGESQGKYDDKDGLMLPWDTIVTGTIDFEIQTYDEEGEVKYTFDTSLPIGNEKELRGVGGKYTIEEMTHEG